MSNTTQEVWKLLIKNPAIQRSLANGLINVRALAKYFIKRYMLKASIDSVISAIRRFSIDEVFDEPYDIITNIFSSASISTRSNIACIKLKNKSYIDEYLSKVSELTNFDEKEVLRIIKGKRTLKIIIDEKEVDKIVSIFKDKDLLEIKKGLTEISLDVPTKADQTKGVVSAMTNEILLHNINIWELICCVPEFLVYVDNKDVLKAHESLLHICQKKSH